MGFEVDFLAVGDGERGGDSIALRFGDLNGERSDQTVIIIDGGTKDSGQELVDHINEHYGTNMVDYVFLTHPDSDHSSGLTVVLEEMEVGHLFMHQPWEYADEIKKVIEQEVTEKTVENRFRKSLKMAHSLKEIADEKGIQITEPFEGLTLGNGMIHILGPHQDFYKELLPDFRGITEMTETDSGASILKQLLTKAKDALVWVEEAMHIETLDDSGETSPENNSSAIILVSLGGKQLMFTGDAGIPALTAALDYCDGIGLALNDLHFFQIPHHGSRRNIGPGILNRIQPNIGYVSAPKEGDPKHPSKRVTNALIRRNIKPYSTQGKGLRHHDNAPERSGWSAATPLPFHEKFQE